MRRALIVLFLLMASFAGTRVSALESYLKDLDDVPLAPGLAEMAGGLVFDSPGGRIVEAAAKGEATPQSIRAFYTETLQPLGWTVVGDMQFRRDNEVLRIQLEDKKPPLIVHFSLTPAH